MSFISVEYLFFFFSIFFLFYLVDKKYKSILLILSGIIFYSFNNVLYTGILFYVIITTYFFSFKVNSEKVLFFAISLILLPLFFYKYFYFFNSLFTLDFNKLTYVSSYNINYLIPLAISFYTLQSIGYLLDIRNNNQVPEKNFLHFFSFIIFFPQLVAGPIERGKNLLPQLKKICTTNTFNKVNYKNIKLGIKLIIIGLTKKLVIADNFSTVVDEIFGNIGNQTGGQIILGAYFFAFQIFFDFSAYTDIARGSAYCFNIKLMKNFNNPYSAQTFSDYWKRWHISLTSWFRDYIYIPYGGKKNSIPKKYFLIFSIFIISGIWHGANLTFIIWGLIHFFLYAFENKILFTKLKGKIYWFLRVFVVFNSVSFAWILFRSPSIGDALLCFQKIAANTFYTFYIPYLNHIGENTSMYYGLDLVNILFFYLNFKPGLWVALFCVFIYFITLFYRPKLMIENLNKYFFLTLIILIIFTGAFGIEEFIYFQF